jgi:hypothetical protein
MLNVVTIPAADSAVRTNCGEINICSPEPISPTYRSCRGLMRFKDGVLTSFSAADGLAGNGVKVIIESKSGGLWIGTYDGLSHYKNGKFTSWREADG